MKEIEFENHFVAERKDLLHFVEKNLDKNIYKHIAESPEEWIEELNIINNMLAREGIVCTEIHSPPIGDPDFKNLGNDVFLYRGREAKQKAKLYDEMKIYPENRVRFEEDGWFFKKQLKNMILMKKEKTYDELLENDIWLLFKHLGFYEMNKDRHFKIQANSSPKQIDVYAKDDHNIFVIFCTTKEKEEKTIRLKNLLNEVVLLKGDISNSIKKYYHGEKLRISFLIVTRGIIWDEKDEELAKKYEIFFWRDSEIDEYKNITEQIGTAAKYQIYSLLFGNKPAFEVEKIEIPAMRGGVGNEKYYCFLIQPEKLFKIAYVHRKEKTNIKEIGNAYQRIANKQRIEGIGRFIDKGNHFPNNIIISFNKEPIFKPLKKETQEGGITYGILKFPPYYGCAWIIDGQHRLYGYSKSNHSSDHTLPVIAYKSLSVKDQANLFVSINEKQVPVSQNLLWDLYPDIYEGSKDKEQKLLRTISLTAKALNSDKDSPIKGEIKIPSLIKDKEKASLTLETICRVIKDNKLLDEEGGILFEETYDNTILLASKIIEIYFEEVKELFKKEWELGKRGMIKSNVGIRIFFILLRQILKYLDYKGEEKVYKKNNLNEFKKYICVLFTPVIKKLDEISEAEKEKIRTSSGGAVLSNAKQVAWWIKEEFEVFGLELLKDWAPPRPKEITDRQIRELLENTEKNLREFIIKKLREKYDDKWWKQGVPGDVKKEIQEKIEKDSEGESQQRKEELSLLDDERKIRGYSYTHHLRKIIMDGLNWDFFKNIFIKDKEYTYAMFRSFEKVRIKYQHFSEQELFEDEKNLGFWSMRWIRRHVGLETPKQV